MPKNKTKKKTTGKKITSKTKPRKKARILRTKKPARRAKGNRKEKDLSPDVIFDSKIGDTDALFVSTPEPSRPVLNKPPVSVEIDPAIAQALKEFAELQDADSTPETEDNNSAETPQAKVDDLDNLNLNNMEDKNPAAASLLSPEVAAKNKKVFSWRKLFNRIFGK